MKYKNRAKNAYQTRYNNNFPLRTFKKKEINVFGQWKGQYIHETQTTFNFLHFSLSTFFNTKLPIRVYIRQSSWMNSQLPTKRNNAVSFSRNTMEFYFYETWNSEFAPAQERSWELPNYIPSLTAEQVVNMRQRF